MHSPLNQPLALSVYGPNGFLRAARGAGDCALEVARASAPGGDIRLHLHNRGDRALALTVRDQSYGRGARRMTIPPGGPRELIRDLQPSHHGYDLTISVEQHEWRLAGHVEDGRESLSDPANVAPILT